MYEIDSNIKEWLKDCWRRSNIPKYQHYFEPWFNNLTDAQLMHFSKQKKNIENGSLTNWITKK